MEATSSFRIERQYVSFVTAETRLVHQPGQIPDTKAFFAGTDAAGRTEHADEMERRCAEILERTHRQADEKAALILERAKADADKIVSEAKKLAEDLVEDARMSAADIREDAKRTGYSEGQISAQTCAEVKKSKEEKELSQLVEKLHSDYTGLVYDLRADVISLVIDIVKKVIGIKLSESDDIFMNLVGSALEQLKQAGAMIIHISSEDYIRYFGKEPGNGSIRFGKMEATVIEEEGYSPGDLVVESENEMLDYSIDKQIERVEKAFLQEGK